MGLFDRFRRPRDPAPAPPAPPDEWLARGRLEAEVNTLRLEWSGYRDQLNRLVQRLEKRDQRAAARETPPPDSDAEAAQEYDPFEAERKLSERRANALLRRG